MTAVKLTKIICILCIVLVFIAMLFRGIYTILFGLLVLLPLALYDRYLMKKEETITKGHLDAHSAQCGIIGICYEGNDVIKQEQLCELLFKGKEIMILTGENVENLSLSFSIEKKKIVDVEMLSLDKIKEISQTNLYDTLGAIGEYYYTNIDNKTITQKSRKDKTVTYLFIKYKDENQKKKLLSFFINNDYVDLNRRLQIKTKVEDYCKENY